MSSETKPVYSVIKIDSIVVLRTVPPTLVVTAKGTTRTSGWSNGKLIPREYVTPPEDGYQEFDFVADAPEEGTIVLPYTAPILGVGYLPDSPDWVKGVRIVSETNDLQRELIKLPPALFESEYSDIIASDEEEFVSDGGDKVFEGELEEHITGEDQEEQVTLFSFTSSQVCSDVTLISVGGVPETKTEFEVRCVVKDPFSGKCLVSTKVPIIYRRTSKIRIVARVCYPSDKEILYDATDCLKQGVAAGILVGVVTSGNLAAATAAMQAYVLACLETKLSKAVENVTVDLRRSQTHGPWKKI